MAVPMRNGRRRAAGAGPMVRAFGETRTCAQDGCTAQLSRYNPARRCALHQGWDRQKVTRPRIRQKATVVGDCPGWLLGIVARLVVVGLLGKKACATSRVEAPQPQQGEAVYLTASRWPITAALTVSCATCENMG